MHEPARNSSAISALEVAVSTLPQLPSLLRYWDDFAEVWRTIRDTSLDEWRLEADGKIEMLAFHNFEPPVFKLLLKHWLVWALGKHACATVSIRFSAISRLESDKIKAFMEILLLDPLEIRERWHLTVRPICSNLKLHAMKSMLCFCCEFYLGKLNPGLRDFIGAFGAYPPDKYASVRQGDVFLSLPEEVAITAYLDDLSAKVRSHSIISTNELRNACILSISYQHAMRPIQIAKLRLSDVTVHQLTDGPSVQLLFYRAKQRNNGRRYSMLRTIKREWCWLFDEYHKRRTSDLKGSAFVVGKGALLNSYFGLNPPSVRNVIKTITKSLSGIARPATDLRHSAAQRLVDAGASHTELAEFMGHAWSETGLAYFDASPVQAERVNRALALSPIYSKVAEVARTRKIDMPALLALPPEHQIGAVPHGIPIAGIGACDLGQSLCAKNPVLSCYTCSKFLAVRDSQIHQEVLESLRPVVLQFYDASRGENFTPAYMQLRTTLESVQRVISEVEDEE
ncbi:site-specific integrase [Pseudomonas cavernicola]|uniref:Site-specific integrase n=1 Tax=Pseudomonas cavernicola TaxID=2320866 RepID=A0A418X994_9PSED|nr:site-specific integrase [Pseudomonas cavernicola]RJG09055.1 site-specific integrase [Pseudomonas cavernicola]